MPLRTTAAARGQRQVDDSKRFHSNAAVPRRYCRRRRPARSPQEGRRQFRRLLPVPQRKDAVVHGEPDQAVLSLLRLRGPWHRSRLPDGVQRQDVSRGDRGARARRRPGGAPGRAAPGRSRAARAGAGPRRDAARRREVLPRRVEGRPAGDRIPQGTRSHRRDRRAFRHRLRARRAGSRSPRRSSATTIRSSRPPGSCSPAKAESATTGFATGSCFPSTTAAAR